MICLARYKSRALGWKSGVLVISSYYYLNFLFLWRWDFAP